MKLSKCAAVVASGAMLLLSLTACGGGDPLATSSSGGGSSKSGTVTVGSANFPESALLAEIYAQALRAKGVTVKEKLNIGAREAYIPALQDGSIDLIPEYSGVLDQYFNKNASALTSDAVYAELKSSLPAALTVLDKSAAEDKDAIVVTKATASKYNLTSIADLASVASKLTLGGPPEWKTRADGVPGLKRVYGVTFSSFRVLDAGGPLVVQALKNGQIQAGDMFTTDPTIEASGFVALQDPKSLYAAQNVVPLIAKSKVTPTISAALDAVSAKLDTTTLMALMKQVQIDKVDPAKVAGDFLKQAGLV